ncbi:uncharacterized protein [Argopecten irradians]|uniref:uncharacterized protein n=1 Tax=Argopecten irradians TaxID=31199 RepID=UPI00370FAC4C
MSMCFVLVAVNFIILLVDCISGKVAVGDNGLQDGELTNDPMIKVNHLSSPGIAEPIFTIQQEIPGNYYPTMDNDPIGDEGNSTPQQGRTEPHYPDIIPNNVGGKGSNPVSDVDIIPDYFDDVAKSITEEILQIFRSGQNSRSIMMAKLLESFMFGDLHQGKFGLARSGNIRDGTNESDTAKSPLFKPVKTIADVMALGRPKAPEVIRTQKKAFFCPLMYRTAFSVNQCWRLAKIFKARQIRMRKQAIAREKAMKKKLAYLAYRRMRKLSA